MPNRRSEMHTKNRIRLAVTTILSLAAVLSGCGNSGSIGDVIVTAERRGDDVVMDTTYPKPPNNVDVIVNFDITAPPGLAVELLTVNGVMTVEGMEQSIVARGTNSVIDVQGARGPLDVSAVNGLITADLTELLGEGTFSTVNGNVTVTARKGEMPIPASTLNGNVTVSIPDDFNGSLNAQTSNGSASSDFSVTLTETRRNNRIVGGIGEGGDSTIRLRSTNGNVRLRKVGG